MLVLERLLADLHQHSLLEDFCVLDAVEDSPHLSQRNSALLSVQEVALGEVFVLGEQEGSLGEDEGSVDVAVLLLAFDVLLPGPFVERLSVAP